MRFDRVIFGFDLHRLRAWAREFAGLICMAYMKTCVACVRVGCERMWVMGTIDELVHLVVVVVVV